MSGTPETTNPPSFNICLRGVSIASVAAVSGTEGVEKIAAACSCQLSLPKCVWEPYGICCRPSNRAGG